MAPAVLPVIRALTKVTEAITNFVKSGAGQVTLIFTAIAVAAKGVAIITPVIIGQLATLATSFQVAAINSALASTGLKGVAASSFLAAGGITKATIALSALKIALIKTGIGAAIVVLGSLAAKFIDNKNAAKEAADAAKAFDDNIKGIVETAETTEFALNKLAIARKEFELSQLSTNRSDRGTALALDKAFNDQTIALLKNISAMEAKLAGKEEEFNMEQRINELKEKFGELDAQQIIDLIKQEELLKKKVEIMTKQEEIAKKINGAFKQIGEDIGTGITDALVGAIEGTRTLGEAAKSIINDLASSLLRLGVQMALTGLFGGTKIGGFLGFANGGRPPVGKPSIVGERGPEIFVPRSAGTIIPNNQIGGVGGGIVNNINVNVSAEGMQSNANEDRGKELGVALASAIQSELIKQKRPGGLLAT